MKMKPYTDQELLEFGPDLGSYLATLTAREQKIFRAGFTVGYKRGLSEGQNSSYDKGYADGENDERAAGRAQALRDGINNVREFFQHQQRTNAAGAAPPDFITTLGFTKDDIESVYKRKAKTMHPDVGGSHEAMTQLNKAREMALEELEHGPKARTTRRRK